MVTKFEQWLEHKANELEAGQPLQQPAPGNIFYTLLIVVPVYVYTRIVCRVKGHDPLPDGSRCDRCWATLK
jgi:hypothetical protein